MPEVVPTGSVRDTTEPPFEAATQPNEPESPTQETPTSNVLEVRNSPDDSLIGDDSDPDRNSLTPETTTEEVE